MVTEKGPGSQLADVLCSPNRLGLLLTSPSQELVSRESGFFSP